MKNIILITIIALIAFSTSCVKRDFDRPEEYPLYEGFVEDIGNFTAYNVKGDAVWTHGVHNSDNYMEISGYNKGENEDWLISPPVDLRNKNKVFFSFTHGIGYLKDWKMMSVWISSDYDGESNPAEQGTWKAIEGYHEPKPNGNFSKIEESGDFDISEYAGSEKFYVAFKYTCTEFAASTWEISSVKIKDKVK